MMQLHANRLARLVLIILVEWMTMSMPASAFAVPHQPYTGNPLCYQLQAGMTKEQYGTIQMSHFLVGDIDRNGLTQQDVDGISTGDYKPPPPLDGDIVLPFHLDAVEYESLLSLDPNHDGRLTVDEWSKIVKHTFRLIDRDKDRIVSEREFNDFSLRCTSRSLDRNPHSPRAIHSSRPR